jgi:hypothetical protein
VIADRHRVLCSNVNAHQQPQEAYYAIEIEMFCASEQQHLCKNQGRTEVTHRNSRSAPPPIAYLKAPKFSVMQGEGWAMSKGFCEHPTYPAGKPYLQALQGTLVSIIPAIRLEGCQTGFHSSDGLEIWSSSYRAHWYP